METETLYTDRYDSDPSLPRRFSFLQNKQLTSLVVFCILQNTTGGNCLLLPVTGYAHVYKRQITYRQTHLLYTQI